MTLALEIKNLQKTYSDGVIALDGLDLTVEQGDFFALLGPNGAGKSTTIGIITSLTNKSSGSVKVFGYDVDTHLREAQSSVGIVPQEFNFNVFEKVEDIIYNQAGYYGISRNAVKDRLETYLKKLDLWDKRHTQANRLSGGMKRRLMVARALIHNPKLLILDEPTAGVDLEIRRAMWEFIQEINETHGTTIILTTHYLEEAEQFCKNIAIIDNGKVIEQTDMPSLLSRLDEEVIVLDVEGLPESGDVNIPDFRMTIKDTGSLEVVIGENQSITQLFVHLEKRGITVKSMRNKSNRLEELFLRLVKRDKPNNASNESTPATTKE